MRDPHRDQEPTSFACAIFANSSEYPEELAFEKGEQLRIISDESGPNLAEGWWLCENEQGQQGIAPANRLQRMTTHTDDREPFDRKFFQVASPLMDDFFLFNLSSPFDDPFFRDRAAFTSSFRDRLDLHHHPLPDLSSSSSPYEPSYPKRPQVVRNIPIVVQNGRQGHQSNSNLSSLDGSNRLSSNLHEIPSSLRRTVSSGPTSPKTREHLIGIQSIPHTVGLSTSSSAAASAPSPPTRRHFLSTAAAGQDSGLAASSLTVNSVDDFDQHQSYPSSENGRRQARTLVVPSSIPGRSIEIPLSGSSVGYDATPAPPSLQREHSVKERKPESSSASSQLERLSQRLKKLAHPFKNSSSHNHSHDDHQHYNHYQPLPQQTLSQQQQKTLSMPNLLQREKRVESPSNSSGIGADIMDTTDSSNSSEEQKRTSDLSSLSDQNSLLSDLVQDDSSRVYQPSSNNQLKQNYLSRLSREKSPSTSVLQSVFDHIGRENQKPKIPILSTFAGSRNSDPLSGILLDDDMMHRNNFSHWNRDPISQSTDLFTADTREKTPGNDTGTVLQLQRKNIICTNMSEALKLIENGVEKINKATAAQHWRGAHILNANLNTLQNAVATINEGLDSFVVNSGRISVKDDTPIAQELKHLLAPLLVPRTTIASLRKSLDSTGWTVAALSRDRNSVKTMDPLEKFIFIAQEVPRDCHRLLQWMQHLVPSTSAVFLNPTSLTALSSISQNPAYNQRSDELRNFQRMEDRLNNLPSYASNAELKASLPSLVTPSPVSDDFLLDKIAHAPSISSIPSNIPSIVPSVSNSSNSSLSDFTGAKKLQTVPLRETKILEEDDLESVYSDRDSLLQDYAYLDDVIPGRTVAGPSIAEEDRQLIRFYLPQIEQHTNALSQAIEAFLATVEKSSPPREFVQKGKLIILTVHKLIYIGDTVSQCIKSKVISENMRTCADRLCDLLKHCVRVTKIAADEYPDIKSMQTMVDSIISVSKSAHDLKAQVTSYC